MNLKMKKYVLGLVISLLTGAIVPIWWNFTMSSVSGKKSEKGDLIWYLLVVALISIVVYTIWYFASHKKIHNSMKPLPFIVPCLIVAIAALAVSVLVPLFTFSDSTKDGVLMYVLLDWLFVTAGAVGATLIGKPE